MVTAKSQGFTRSKLTAVALDAGSAAAFTVYCADSQTAGRLAWLTPGGKSRFVGAGMPTSPIASAGGALTTKGGGVSAPTLLKDTAGSAGIGFDPPPPPPPPPEPSASTKKTPPNTRPEAKGILPLAPNNRG